MKIFGELRRSVQKMANMAGLSAERTRLYTRLVAGISKTGSCVLSATARALPEGQGLREAERELSEGLARPDDDLASARVAHVRQVAPVANTAPFIGVDGTDIVHPYGKAFQFLDKVRDASSKRKSTDPGYWAVQIEALFVRHLALPVWYQPFSTKMPDYVGWFEMWLAAIRIVLPHVGRNAVWLFDRGFDALEVFDALNALNLRWVVRLRHDRKVLLANGEEIGLRTLGQQLAKRLLLQIPYVDKRNHKEKLAAAKFNFAPVDIPDLGDRHWVIAISAGRKHDIVLLTKCPAMDQAEAKRIALAYLRRWGGEESLRCWKQCTGVEKAMVRSWLSIQRITFLAMVAYAIQAIWLLTRQRLARRLIASVQQFHEQVPFENYRLWMGTKLAIGGT